MSAERPLETDFYLLYRFLRADYVMPAQINPEAKKIYAVMGLKATTTAYPLY